MTLVLVPSHLTPTTNLPYLYLTTSRSHPYEVQGDWNCNVAAVNHYAHSKESVGFHADKLTYLGPRPTIGSLTLGVTRFFRIRKVIPDAKHPDTAGQLISIALPHNSLCIMWPPMVSYRVSVSSCDRVVLWCY